MPTIQKTLRIFEFIKRFYVSNNVTPTMAEIGKQFDLSSPASVFDHLKKMEAKGLITRVPNVSRGIRIVDQETNKAA